VSGGPTFDDELESLGFRPAGSSRRGGRRWDLAYSRVLTIMLHDYDDHVVLTWHCDLGRALLERDLRTSPSDVGELELFPAHDVRLPLDTDAITREISRVLGLLRIDLGEPDR
jgi:hypothetical protein